VLQGVLSDMDSDDLIKQTACTEYAVAQLADHMMGSIASLGGCAGTRMPQRDQKPPLESQVADAAQAALEAWRRRGLEGTVELAPQEVPAAMPVNILSLEFLIHAWDFASATGRDVVVSEPVADYALDLAGKVITPEARGFAGFAVSVETVADAAVLDRLIAFTGRQPAVVQTSTN
jgi:uncharacterized protein (TIGR03086 family)